MGSELLIKPIMRLIIEVNKTGDVQISNISMRRNVLEKVEISASKISQIVGSIEKIQRSKRDIKINDIQAVLTKAGISKAKSTRVIEGIADYPGFGTFRPRETRR